MGDLEGTRTPGSDTKGSRYEYCVRGDEQPAEEQKLMVVLTPVDHQIRLIIETSEFLEAAPALGPCKYRNLMNVIVEAV